MEDLEVGHLLAHFPIPVMVLFFPISLQIEAGVSLISRCHLAVETV